MHALNKLNALLLTSAALNNNLILLQCPAERMEECKSILPKNKPGGRSHIVSKSEQARIVVTILWSADLKMSFLQVNKTTLGEKVFPQC